MSLRSRLPAVEDVGADLVERGVLGSAQTMTLEKVFWSHFSSALTPSQWVLGALLVGIGLDFTWGLVALIVGNIIGGAAIGACATIGPSTGLTQIEISRFSFGRIGTRLPAILNWSCAVGWDAVNNVLSVLALIALSKLLGLHLPFWLGLAALTAIQLSVSLHGHHLVQLVTKYGGYVLTAVFAITEVVAIIRGGTAPVAHQAITPAIIFLGIMILAGSTLGFAPYTSDYTRYLPRMTPARDVFGVAFLATALGGTAVGLCGFLTAGRLTDVSPSGIIETITGLVGPFASVALFAIASSSIVANSINDNTAAYSLMSAGIRIKRAFAAAITAILGYAVAVAGAGSFAMLFSQFVVLLGYWIAPWTAIVLADRFFTGDTHRPPQRWGSGLIIFAIITPLTIVLFSATTSYTGPVARLLGGTDIGYLVGFITAGGLYIFTTRLQRRHLGSTVESTQAGVRA